MAVIQLRPGESASVGWGDVVLVGGDEMDSDELAAFAFEWLARRLGMDPKVLAGALKA